MDYKFIAKDILRGKWKDAVIVTLVAALLGGLITGASVDLTFGLESDDLPGLPPAVIAFLWNYLRIVGPFALILGYVRFIIGGMIQLGYCGYLLKLYDGESAKLEDLFSETDRFMDGFVLNLLTSLLITLWSLLFIIPGIIASLRYAMAPFILYENPYLSPMDAITSSKQVMDGNKLELFVLDLSFIGWALLSAITLGIGYLWLNPYMNMTYATFYRSLCPKTSANP